MVAGISGFRDQYVCGRIASADLLHRWADEEHFSWLYSEDILAEYKAVLRRMHVRSAVIGTLINLIRERAQPIEIHYSAEISPDPKDDAFCICAEQGHADFIFTLNPRDFPQSRLKTKVVQPAPAQSCRGG